VRPPISAVATCAKVRENIEPPPASAGAAIAVSAANLRAIMRLNETTLIEITLRRNVREGVFRLARGVDTRGRFDDDKPGPII
jgi:hypothetical protein